MCTIKFLIRQPWLYIVVGLLLLGMMVFSVVDAKSSRHVVPLERLQPYTGTVVEVKPIGQNAQTQRYQISFVLEDAHKKRWQVNSSLSVPVGSHVVASLYNHKVYDLVAGNQHILDYQDVIAQDIARAQSAKETLTNPVTILLIFFLMSAGVAIILFKHRYPERYQKYCVCAMDRIKQMEQEAAGQ